MKPVAIENVISFLKTVTPFDLITIEDLKKFSEKLILEFFPKGELIARQGEGPLTHLYLIQSGAVKIFINIEGEEQDILIDYRGEGDFFGMASLIGGTPLLSSLIAQEDTICYLLPKKELLYLMSKYPQVNDFFSQNLASLCQLYRGTFLSQIGQSYVQGRNGAIELRLLNTSLEDLIKRPPVTCSFNTSIIEAAKIMTRENIGSIVVTNQDGEPMGIVTDSDFREKAIIKNLPPESPIASIMNQPLITIEKKALAFEALVTMVRKNIRHLVVVKKGRLVGIVSEKDIIRLQGGNPLAIMRGIDSIRTMGDLNQFFNNIDLLLSYLFSNGTPINRIMELTSIFYDGAYTRLIEIAEEEVREEIAGSLIPPYCWLCLGIDGRRERLFRFDLQNAIFYTDTRLSHELKMDIRNYFFSFAQKVVSLLYSAGFSRYHLDITATDSNWCKSQVEWENTISSWTSSPSETNMRFLGILTDFRILYGTKFLEDNIWNIFDRYVIKKTEIIKNFAQYSLSKGPPIGLFRNHVLGKNGRQEKVLDLLTSALIPLVDAVRILSMETGITEKNTYSRIVALKQKGVFSEEQAEDLQESFSILNMIRLERYFYYKPGSNISKVVNFFKPSELDRLKRKMLRGSFRTIYRLREMLSYRYQIRLE